jgi:hypothetical protein
MTDKLDFHFFMTMLAILFTVGMLMLIYEAYTNQTNETNNINNICNKFNTDIYSKQILPNDKLLIKCLDRNNNILHEEIINGG